MSENPIDDVTENGTVRISNEVVAIIAGVAATEIEGVVGMSGGFTGGITDMLGMKNLSKGVEVELGEMEAKIDAFIVVEYGRDISEVGKAVQENVKKTVETMTGLNVIAVNVNVQGVDIPQKIKDKEDELK